MTRAEAIENAARALVATLARVHTVLREAAAHCDPIPGDGANDCAAMLRYMAEVAAESGGAQDRIHGPTCPACGTEDHPEHACAGAAAGHDECMKPFVERRSLALPAGPPESDGVYREVYRTALLACVRGMAQWGGDEDGVHPDAWPAFEEASYLSGMLPCDHARPDVRGPCATCAGDAITARVLARRGR